MSIKGYKVFNPDWTCRGFQYEVGKTFEHNGDIEMCGAGFHFCRKLSDCFGYYSFNSNNKVAEVEAVGLVETEGDKSVTNKIRIVKELTWHDVLDMCNTGKDCTGNSTVVIATAVIGTAVIATAVIATAVIGISATIQQDISIHQINHFLHSIYLFHLTEMNF